MCAKCLNHVNVWPPCFAAFLNSVVDLSARIASENRRLEMYVYRYKVYGCWVVLGVVSGSAAEIMFQIPPDWRLENAAVSWSWAAPNCKAAQHPHAGPAPPSSGETLRPHLPWNKANQTPRSFLLRVAVSKTRPGHIAAVFTAS